MYYPSSTLLQNTNRPVTLELQPHQSFGRKALRNTDELLGTAALEPLPPAASWSFQEAADYLPAIWR